MFKVVLVGSYFLFVSFGSGRAVSVPNALNFLLVVLLDLGQLCFKLSFTSDFLCFFFLAIKELVCALVDRRRCHLKLLLALSVGFLLLVLFSLDFLVLLILYLLFASLFLLLDSAGMVVQSVR